MRHNHSSGTPAEDPICCCPCVIHERDHDWPDLHFLHPRDDQAFQEGTMSMDPGDVKPRGERNPSWWPINDDWYDIMRGGCSGATDPLYIGLYNAHAADNFAPAWIQGYPNEPPSRWDECCLKTTVTRRTGTVSNVDRDGGPAWADASNVVRPEGEETINLALYGSLVFPEGSDPSDWLTSTNFEAALPHDERSDWSTTAWNYMVTNYSWPAGPPVDIVKYSLLTNIKIRVYCKNEGSSPSVFSSVQLVYDGTRLEGACNDMANARAVPETPTWVEFNVPTAYNIDYERDLPAYYDPADMYCEYPYFYPDMFVDSVINESDFGAALSFYSGGEECEVRVYSVEIEFEYSIFVHQRFYPAIWTYGPAMIWLKKPVPGEHGPIPRIPLGTSGSSEDIPLPPPESVSDWSSSVGSIEGDESVGHHGMVWIYGKFRASEYVYVILGYDADEDVRIRNSAYAVKIGLFDIPCTYDPTLANSVNRPNYDSPVLGIQAGRMTPDGEFRPFGRFDQDVGGHPIPVQNTSSQWQGGYDATLDCWMYLPFAVILSADENIFVYHVTVDETNTWGFEYGGATVGSYSALKTTGDTSITYWKWEENFFSRYISPDEAEVMYPGWDYATEVPASPCFRIPQCIWCGESYNNPTKVPLQNLHCTVEFLGLADGPVAAGPTSIAADTPVECTNPTQYYGDLIGDYICPTFTSPQEFTLKWVPTRGRWCYSDEDYMDTYGEELCNDTTTRAKGCEYCAGAIDTTDPSNTTQLPSWPGPISDYSVTWLMAAFELYCEDPGPSELDPDNIMRFQLGITWFNWFCDVISVGGVATQNGLGTNNYISESFSPDPTQSSCSPFLLVYEFDWFMFCNDCNDDPDCNIVDRITRSDPEYGEEWCEEGRDSVSWRNWFWTRWRVTISE